MLRTQVEPDETFEGLLRQVRTGDVDGFAHADVPFESVVDAVDPVRSEAFAPLAQVLLSFDPGASVHEADLSVAGLGFEAIATDHVPAQLDLYITVSSAVDAAWSGSIIYATDLFDASTVETIANRFVRVLGAVTSAPSVPVGDVSMLADADLTAEADAEWGQPVELPVVTSVSDAVAAQILSLIHI